VLERVGGRTDPHERHPPPLRDRQRKQRARQDHRCDWGAQQHHQGPAGQPQELGQVFSRRVQVGLAGEDAPEDPVVCTRP